jgi:hypothetical protein
VTLHGAYRGGLDGVDDACVGQPAALNVVGIARTSAAGEIAHLDAVTGRMQLAGELSRAAAER